LRRILVHELGLLASIVLSAIAGTLLGFAAGLVPGLHMNNIAASLTAYASVTLAAFGALERITGGADDGILVCCFISAALVAHLFGEAMTSTYVGIPSEDVVSVLPAHRLARAGLGSVAVRASADGCFVGVLIASALLVPMCVLMGPPIHFYSIVKKGMVIIAIGCSVLLVLSEGLSVRSMWWVRGSSLRVIKAAVIFCTSGVLGAIVLQSNYFACALPDLPWMDPGFVPRSSLLLPLFAGLFGVPSLLLSLGSGPVRDIGSGTWRHLQHAPKLGDLVLSVIGGTLVGWLPGMTSGSSTTLCSPTTREVGGGGDPVGSVRFIWLYSAVSSVGAVFSVGALFVIMRARSGSMDAVASFLEITSHERWLSNALPMTSILLSMLIAALICNHAIGVLDSRLVWLRRIMCSKKLAIASLAFILSLCVAITGSRGALLMASSASLGVIPPIIGIRRIQLMGCLLVPISILFMGKL